MPDSVCLKVPKNLGEKAIQLAIAFGIFNRGLKIKTIVNNLYIPLTKIPSSTILEKFKENLSNFEISYSTFISLKKKHLVPLDFLKKQLPSSLLVKIPKAIDFIGGIAIVEISPELQDYKHTIGEAILKAHKQINSVFVKSGVVNGVFRLRNLEHVAGVDKTKTVYKEYGSAYHVDVGKAYLSPRLSNEHNRVASQVKAGEIVIDMFAGVGPFAILISKKQKDVRVYAIDINPDAISLLKENILLNRVEKQVIPIFGDVRQIVCERLKGAADRVIMNLPETSLAFIDVACGAIKPEGGIIHFYCFIRDSDPIKAAKRQLTEAVNENQRSIKKFLVAKTVREVAPYTYQVVVDAEIQ